MQDVGWGIVGCGDVAERKAGRGFSAPGSRLVAVMRRDAEAAQAFAERYSAQLATVSAAEVIEHPDVDIVYIATPPAHHLEYALAAAAAGKRPWWRSPAVAPWRNSSA